MAIIKPIHYKVHLEPNLEEFKSNGYTEININSSEPTDAITLHSHELAIWKCQVKKNEKFIDCEFYINPKKQELSITLPETMVDIFLRVEFVGLINDQLVGFYRSKYEEEGKEKYIAVTQFEEEHARQAFPCFDHPSKKATFDIEFVIDSKLSGIANTRIEEEKELDKGKKLVKFKTTPKMSSYLLFFGIGDIYYSLE